MSTIFLLHLRWLQNVQYVTEGQGRIKTTFPIKALKYPNMRDGTLHASKSRNKFIFIYFIALQPCLIPVS